MMLSKYLKRIKGFFIQEIPADIYACETCDETSCLEGDWENCKYRIKSEQCIQLEQKKEKPE